MKKLALYLILGCCAAFALFSPLGIMQGRAGAEEKPKAEATSTPVKVQIVVTEFEGEKKVKSLPYTLYANAPDATERGAAPYTRLRIGSRVPVYAGNSEMQYIEVGTNIDVRVHTNENLLSLEMSLERAWVEGDIPVPVTKSDAARPENPSGHFREPIFRQFKSVLDLKLREGQPLESTVAVDPISGKVVKVEVSYALAK